MRIYIFSMCTRVRAHLDPFLVAKVRTETVDRQANRDERVAGPPLQTHGIERYLINA